MYKFRTLTAAEIEARVGQVKDGYITLLLYKNARVDMDILDETVGADNWQRKHYEVKGNLFCSVGIYNTVTKEWVFKDDCGTESNTEKEKGEASDSFKRACVNWGIGRELYTAPLIYIKCDCTKGTKSYDLPYKDFEIECIQYNDDRRITKLSITAYNTARKNREVIYKLGKVSNYEPEIDYATEKQLQEIERLNANKVNVCKVYGVSDISKLTMKQADEVIARKRGQA